MKKENTVAKFFELDKAIPTGAKVPKDSQAFYSVDSKGRIALYLNDKKVAQIQKGATDKASKIVVYTSYRLTLNDKTKEQSLARLETSFKAKNTKRTRLASEVIVNPSYARKGRDQFYSKIDFDATMSIDDIEIELLRLALRTPYYNPLVTELDENIDK